MGIGNQQAVVPVGMRRCRASCTPSVCISRSASHGIYSDYAIGYAFAERRLKFGKLAHRPSGMVMVNSLNTLQPHCHIQKQYKFRRRFDTILLSITWPCDSVRRGSFQHFHQAYPYCPASTIPAWCHRFYCKIGEVAHTGRTPARTRIGIFRV